MVQVVLPAKNNILPNPPVRTLDAKHNEIGEAYGLPIANAVSSVEARVPEGMVALDKSGMRCVSWMYERKGEAMMEGNILQSMYFLLLRIGGELFRLWCEP